jgi:hypothetical protein
MSWSFNALWGTEMKRTLIIIVILVISGCAISQRSGVVLYGIYSELYASVKAGRVEAEKARFFSSSYLDEVSSSKKNASFLLAVPRVIEKVDSHYEKIDGAVGCLTVNGYENDGQPVSIYVEYVLKNHEWLIDYIYLNLLENVSGFEHRAICPNKD